MKNISYELHVHGRQMMIPRHRWNIDAFGNTNYQFIMLGDPMYIHPHLAPFTNVDVGIVMFDAHMTKIVNRDAHG